MTHRTAAPSSWDHALRVLEQDVERAEALLAGEAREQPAQDVWKPPTGLGAVPTHLERAALALLERQLEVARRLAAAAGDSRRHDRALSHLSHEAPRPPVYLDTPA